MHYGHIEKNDDAQQQKQHDNLCNICDDIAVIRAVVIEKYTPTKYTKKIGAINFKM